MGDPVAGSPIFVIYPRAAWWGRVPEGFDLPRPLSSCSENTDNAGLLLLSRFVTLYPVTVKCGKKCGTDFTYQK